MEHTNEFLQGMFAAYMGCEVKDIRQNRIGKVTSINKTRVWYEHMNNNVGKSLVQHFAFYAEVKPVLTPLFEITDEDAEVLGKYRYCDPKALSHSQIGKGIINDYLREDRINGKFELERFEIDYLRSRHYDCGYMHIASLITAGLAIKKTI